METTLSQANHLNDKIFAHEIPSLLNRYATKIKVLSLDCFDTLIWRTTATPADIFYEAQQSPAFQELGLTAILRAQAETRARQMRCFKQQGAEVTLHDIYREHLPTATDQQLHALAAAEIAAEQAACYAFPPMIELIRTAHQQGTKIIVVSDTYFTEEQLRLLLNHVLPEDVMHAISHIFCSSQHGRSKAAGLFDTVIRSVNEKPENFLHVGDNMTADYIAARTLKLNALHFIPNNDYIKNLQRLHSTAANLINPAIRTTRPLSDPFRAFFAMSESLAKSPAFLMGHYSLGPVMYCFARYILEEIEKIRLSGKEPKVLFLLRDGYLPALACQALVGGPVGHCVNISRFSAYAASFRTEDDIDRYLAIVKSNRFYDMARQLLLPPKVAEPLIKTAERSVNPEEEFIRLIHRRDVLNIIFKKSAEYRERLICYLKKEIALKNGDTLLFIDLGYAGTAQRQLAPIFKEMNVDIEGRYLIALSAATQKEVRKGLLDAAHYDDKTLLSIVHFISLLEQLCTSNGKSVIDYDDKGNVIYSDVSMSEQQHNKLAAVQEECIRFIQHVKKFPDISQKLSRQVCREMTLAEIARMIFLPTGPELHYLQSFQFDLNLGTNDVYPLFDPKKGLEGLKRRGLFYIDKNFQAKRTHYPAELRIAGFELALTFMSHMRFNLEANFEDMLPRKEFIEIQLKQQDAIYTKALVASATHDGYYSVWVEANGPVSFCIGKRYRWIQVESAELIKEDAFINQKEAGNMVDVKSALFLEGITQHDNGLLQCLSESGVIKFTPNLLQSREPYIFRLVYRPLVFNVGFA